MTLRYIPQSIGIIRSLHYRKILINVFNGLSMDWQLPFDVSKCKVLHLGHFNPNCSYTMADIILWDVFEEKDLDVIVDKDLKFHVQTAAVINKVNRLLELIKKCFVNISIECFIILYKSLVHPCLEYGNVIWRPFYVCIWKNQTRKYPKESHQDDHYYKSF